ncbi:MAG: hypothetical protein A3F73_13865 [Gallionellales bacterium RIFCSPLOWO2_12_FULL_59_22]|nr:MAG: hypothetical protein A3H99_06170 [Gallionellales bacterium RIFCSPLOWO2_02_FULL_59_110]OGT02027.1 MAG: hypothetical protein A2Z65_02190 [Gallionellales bacterium RIFCSPLOWO2_02_58_13]OGT10401.1 MAG: hypothetical protein A3F73_13865 [Gallionellales bacterium RIFCSPLOWO2_12_FULL_59_22]
MGFETKQERRMSLLRSKQYARNSHNASPCPLQGGRKKAAVPDVFISIPTLIREKRENPAAFGQLTVIEVLIQQACPEPVEAPPVLPE